MPADQTQQDIINILKKANHVLILPSSPVDGDSIGSALSLYLALQKLGKKVTVVAEETPNTSYNFLPEIERISHELNFVRDFVVTIDCRDTVVNDQNIRHEIQGNKVNIIISPSKGGISADQVSFGPGKSQYDCIVTVDAADPSQFGKLYENATELFHLVPVINIDHHTSNSSFGKINLVDIMASSTTTLILPLIEELGPSLMDADIATLLLAGLITDTSSFQNPNTTPEAFTIASKLIGYGARQQEIIRNIYKTKKLSTLRLWGRTLSKIQYDDTHKIVWSVLTARDFAEIGSSSDETEGVIDELMSNAPNTEVIFLLKEKSPTEVGGSIRTLSSSIDASKIAGLFGGGGHMQAAGFRMSGKSIQQAEEEVVAAIRDFQKKRLKLPITETPAIPPAVQQSPTLDPPAYAKAAAGKQPLTLNPARHAAGRSAYGAQAGSLGEGGPQSIPSQFIPPIAPQPTTPQMQVPPKMSEFKLTQEFVPPTPPFTPPTPPQAPYPSYGSPFPPQPGMLS